MPQTFGSHQFRIAGYPLLLPLPVVGKAHATLITPAQKRVVVAWQTLQTPPTIPHLHGHHLFHLLWLLFPSLAIPAPRTPPSLPTQLKGPTQLCHEDKTLLGGAEASRRGG